MKCTYCSNEAKWVENKEIYGRNYGKSYMVWYCKPCDAYVGCHKNTQKPLGRMANRELREWRKRAKSLFIDVKMNGNWRAGKKKTKAYEWVNNFMGKEFHFGDSTIEDCQKIYEYLRVKK